MIHGGADIRRPNGEREGPAQREGEGDTQLSSCCRKQTRRRKLPLTFPSPRRWVPSSPRGGRRSGATSQYAIALRMGGNGRAVRELSGARPWRSAFSASPPLSPAPGTASAE